MRGGSTLQTFTGIYIKKRIDRLIEIDNFFNEAESDRIAERGQRLSQDKRDELEGQVTSAELDKSLKSSNLNSSPGWDGVSYKFLKSFWEFIKLPLTKMANEGFEQGFLSPTLRTGLIKIIPKGKNNTKVSDWRPITLLTTSYKLISGVVAGRLEKALPTIIGRGQKGFLKYKNMGTCVLDGRTEALGPLLFIHV